MKAKKRLVIVSLFFLLVAMIAVFSVAMVFAATEQSIKSNISIGFKSDNVAGSVNVKYRIGEEDWIDVGSVTFDGAERTDNKETLDIFDILQIDYDSPYVVFEYDFTNIGEKGYWATFTIAEDLSAGNLTDTYSINNVSFGSLNNGIFVSGAKDLNTPTTQKYYVKISVKDLYQDANMTLHFNCELFSLDKTYEESEDTIFVGSPAGITSYASLTDAINSATAGETIIINSADAISLTETLTINKNLTIISYYDIEITNSASPNAIEIKNGAVVNFGFEGYGKITITANTTQTNLISVSGGELTLGNVDLVGLNESATVSTSSVSAMATSSIGRAVEVVASGKFTMNSGSIKNFSSTSTTVNGMAINNFIGSDLSLNNVEISNCKTAGDGGAICSDNASLTLNNTTITDCKGRNGGAINAKGKLTIKNSTITNCEASSNGGTLWVSGSECLIENSEISNNKTTSVDPLGYGGAIYQTERNVLTIVNSDFKENSAINHGGAIITLDGCTLNIKSGTFAENISQNQGGVIWARSANVNITGGTFANNSSLNAGGCISTNGTVTLNINETDSPLVMDANESTNLIGSDSIIYCSTDTTLNLTGGTFKNHSSGEVISLNGGTPTINANFYENNCAIYQYTGTSNISGNFIGNKQVLNINGNVNTTVCELNAYIDGNKLDGTTQETNSAIYINGGIVNINGGYLKNSVSTEGSIYCRYASNVTINDGVFENNSSEKGGVLYLNSYYYAKLTINGGTFKNNSATDGGVIYSQSYDNITINGGTFNNNEAQDGGVISASSSSSVTLVGGTFKNNTASRGYDISSSGTITFAGDSNNVNSTVYSDIQLNNTTAGSNLTAVIVNANLSIELSNIYIEGTGYSTGIQNNGTLTLDANIYNCSSKLIRNGSTGTLTIVGGKYKGRSSVPTANNNIIGIYNEGILYANGGTVENCSSSYGAGIYSVHETLLDETTIFTTIAGMTIQNCYSSDYAGAVYCQDTVFAMNSGTITNNTSAQGCAIYAGRSTINITGGTISNNKATGGVAGAVWLTNSSTLNISGGTFDSNTSFSHGGAIYAMSGTTLNVTAGTFINNSCLNDGGAILLDGVVANINATFERNSATNGGAVKMGVNADSSNKIGGTFIANKATETGGAIALYDGAYAKISNSTFTNYKDGVLLTNSDGSTITNAEFGGAIYVGTGTTKAEVYGGEFNGLVASNGGGAIANLGNLLVSGESTTSIVVFSGCSAQIGGAIANSVTATRSGLSVDVVSATAEIKFVTFIQNVATQGETNAIANIGNLTISGSVLQNRNQDISNSKITILGIKTVYGSITASPTLSSLTVSYSNASINSLTNLTDIEFTMSGAGSTSISGVTTITEYSNV